MDIDYYDMRYFYEETEKQFKEQDSIYHKMAIKYGMSDTVLWLLYVISDEDRVFTQQDLCKRCSFPKQTVNTAINNLVKSQLVELITIPGTRNKKQVCLTEKGKAVCSNTTDVLKTCEEKVYGHFSKQELNNYLEMTRLLTEYMKEEFIGIKGEDNND